jgi:hypothetical protein
MDVKFTAMFFVVAFFLCFMNIGCTTSNSNSSNQNQLAGEQKTAIPSAELNAEVSNINSAISIEDADIEATEPPPLSSERDAILASTDEFVKNVESMLDSLTFTQREYDSMKIDANGKDLMYEAITGWSKYTEYYFDMNKIRMRIESEAHEDFDLGTTKFSRDLYYFHNDEVISLQHQGTTFNTGDEIDIYSLPKNETLNQPLNAYPHIMQAGLHLYWLISGKPYDDVFLNDPIEAWLPAEIEDTIAAALESKNQPSGNQAESVYTYSAGESAIITQNHVTMHSEPSLDAFSPDIELEEGDQVQVWDQGNGQYIDQDNHWLQVEYGQMIGWIPAAYAMPKNQVNNGTNHSNPSIPYITENLGDFKMTGYVMGEQVNLRAQPRMNAPIIAQLKLHLMVQKTGEVKGDTYEGSDVWYQINVAGGYQGYIHSKFYWIGD